MMRGAVTARDVLTVDLVGEQRCGRWIYREDDGTFCVRVQLLHGPVIIPLRFADENVLWCRGNAERDVLALAACAALTSGVARSGRLGGAWGTWP